MSTTGWESAYLDDIEEDSLQFVEMVSEARNGVPQAQYALGAWYRLRRKYGEAKSWYRRAADQEHETAKEEYEKLLNLIASQMPLQEGGL